MCIEATVKFSEFITSSRPFCLCYRNKFNCHNDCEDIPSTFRSQCANFAEEECGDSICEFISGASRAMFSGVAIMFAVVACLWHVWNGW